MICCRLNDFNFGVIFSFAEDEEKLSEMSIACESKAKSELNSSGSMLGGMSPGLSGPKFGAEGVNVSRLMALSEKTRSVPIKGQQVRNCSIQSPAL